MSGTLIKLIPKEDMIHFSRIVTKAYPGWKLFSQEMLTKVNEKNLYIQENYQFSNFYGAYRNENLLAGMRVFDFQMNWQCFNKINVGGIGLVAVDLLHKKEKLAKEIVTYFINHYKNLGTNIVALYPFRPDFYKEMGFGYGSKKSAYRFKPSSLPNKASNDSLTYLCEEDAEEILTCYNNYADMNHGMFYRNIEEIKQFFKNEENVFVGIREEGKLIGYIMFQFKQEDEKFLINDIEIQEMVYLSREGRMKLLSFLHKQNDQIRAVQFNTQDDNFHFLLSDPRNGSDNLIPPVYHESNYQGVGIMYKIVNVRGFFEDLKGYSFNDTNCSLKITISDTFTQENEGSTIINFNKGKPEVTSSSEYDVEISLDIAQFSSLVMGAISFRALYEANLVNISSTDYINKINRLFCSEQRPICLTAF